MFWSFVSCSWRWCDYCCCFWSLCPAWYDEFHTEDVLTFPYAFPFRSHTLLHIELNMRPNAPHRIGTAHQHLPGIRMFQLVLLAEFSICSATWSTQNNGKKVKRNSIQMYHLNPINDETSVYNWIVSRHTCGLFLRFWPNSKWTEQWTGHQ